MLFLTDAKRLIGRNYNDPKVAIDIKHWPFDVINDAGKPKISVEYKGEKKTFNAEEISSMVLIKMKQTAEAFLGKVGISFIKPGSSFTQTQISSKFFKL